MLRTTILLVILFCNCSLAAEDIYEQQLKILNNKIDILEHRIDLLEKSHTTSQSQNHHQKVEIIPNIQSHKEIEQTIEPLETIENKEYAECLISLKEAGKADTIELKQAKLSQTIALLENFNAKYPNSKYKTNVHFRLGDSFFLKKDFQNASLHYLESYKTADNQDKDDINLSTKKIDILLKLASSLGEIGSVNNIEKACQVLKKIDQIPESQKLDTQKRLNDIKNKYQCY